MKQKRIMLPTVEEAKEFVATASRCDFDIDVFYNRIIIDAKSLLGVLSLDLTRVLTVEYNGETKSPSLSLRKRQPQIQPLNQRDKNERCSPAFMAGCAEGFSERGNCRVGRFPFFL